MAVIFSIVSPVYKAEGIVPLLVQRIKETLQKITESYEIILVEDGSPDRSWEQIEEACQSDQRVKGIKLSRNFGQHNAIFAGLERAKGEWVVVMDCDLQDRPEEIVNLYHEALRGYDYVLGARQHRNDKWIKKISSKIFYKLLSFFTKHSYDYRTTNFGVYHRKVIQAVLSLKETFKIFPLMIHWVGFKRSVIPVQHDHRLIGKTTYTFHRLIAFSIKIILSYSQQLLIFIIKAGLFISLTSFLIVLYYIYGYFSGRIQVLGYASIIISIWFLSGLILCTLGIIGLYLGQVFEGIKQRPFVITDRIVNIQNEK